MLSITFNKNGGWGNYGNIFVSTVSVAQADNIATSLGYQMFQYIFGVFTGSFALFAITSFTLTYLSIRRRRGIVINKARLGLIEEVVCRYSKYVDMLLHI